MSLLLEDTSRIDLEENIHKILKWNNLCHVHGERVRRV